MMNWLMTSFVYLLIYFIATVLSCDGNFNESVDQGILAAMKSDVLLLVGEAGCSEIGECRALPFGAKPCGGPWEYLIYSSTDTITLKIEEKVNAYNEWNRVLNSRYGYISDCGIAEEPQLLCSNGKCVDGNKTGGWYALSGYYYITNYYT